MTKTFSKNYLKNTLELPYNEELVLSDEIVDNGRWTIQHDLVFKDPADGKSYRTAYQVGATETQQEGPWEYDDTVTATEVKLLAVVKQEYVAVDADITNSFEAARNQIIDQFVSYLESQMPYDICDGEEAMAVARHAAVEVKDEPDTERAAEPAMPETQTDPEAETGDGNDKETEVKVTDKAAIDTSMIATDANREDFMQCVYDILSDELDDIKANLITNTSFDASIPDMDAVADGLYEFLSHKLSWLMGYGDDVYVAVGDILQEASKRTPVAEKSPSSSIPAPAASEQRTFTGFFDSNGKRIYVGNKVKETCNGLIGTVGWDAEAGTYKLMEYGDYYITDADTDWEVLPDQEQVQVNAPDFLKFFEKFKKKMDDVFYLGTETTLLDLGDEPGKRDEFVLHCPDGTDFHYRLGDLYDNYARNKISGADKPLKSIIDLIETAYDTHDLEDEHELE